MGTACSQQCNQHCASDFVPCRGKNARFEGAVNPDSSLFEETSIHFMEKRMNVTGDSLDTAMSAPARDGEASPKEPCIFLVDNSQLQNNGKGIDYRLSACLADRDQTKDAYAPWDTLIRATPSVEGWVQLSEQRFLPMTVGGKPVLTKLEQEELIAISNKLGYHDQERLELQAIQRRGGVVSGKPYDFLTGSTYTGEWLNNMRHGHGRMSWPSGAEYEGQWKCNTASGHGRFKHPEGDVHIGQWRNFLANGKGVYYRKGVVAYCGEWLNDKQHGYGVETTEADATYCGEFSCGRKHGYGCYRWLDGAEYAGRWVDNVIDGHGGYASGEKSFLDGHWQEASIHGCGRYRFSEGQEYQGQYANDKKHGFGRFRWADGKLYEGYWSNGKQEGQGLYTTDAKSVLRSLAVWSNGTLVETLKTDIAMN
mmetsp:Transcript_111100/g.313431  ORF Transcript_111100/g.313431 Transcript_111100/m.313431 type:complete len:423 (+) Transcript_111100:90-1358(+)